MSPLRRRFVAPVLIAGAAAILFAGSVLAAPPGSGNPRFTPLLGNSTRSAVAIVLRRPEVQTTLRLTSKQKVDYGLVPATPAERARRQREAQVRMQRLRPLIAALESATTPEARTQALAAYRTEAVQSYGRTAPSLTPEQTQRLKEIDLQWRGPTALSSVDVAKEVGISNEKRLKIAVILRDAIDETAEVEAEPSLQGNAILQRRAMDKIRRAADEKVLALLTPDEAKRWDEITGDAFWFRADR